MSSDRISTRADWLIEKRLNPLKSGHVFGCFSVPWLRDWCSVLIPSNRVMSSDGREPCLKEYMITSLNPLKSGHVFGSLTKKVFFDTYLSLNPLKSGHVFGCA